MEEDTCELDAEEQTVLIQRDAPIQCFLQYLTRSVQALSKCTEGWYVL